MSENPLLKLRSLGQSAWLDQVRRDWFDGQLQKWIDEDDIRGVTSNPSIFKGAILHADYYDDQIRELAREGLSTEEIYDRLTIDDIASACDVFGGVYEESGGLDGYVSHEVSPRLAYDEVETVSEARRLWAEINRPNLMIKIPATKEGMPAIRQALADGINVNITLMFSMDHYESVVDAFMKGLEDRVGAGKPIDGIASVASIFVSRMDTKADKLLQERLSDVGASGSASAEHLQQLLGRAAVANGKRTYRRYQELFAERRFVDLQGRGARPQRVLWASTSTKNPEYNDVLYVEELIGPDTVNTLPLSTLEAFRDHGRVGETLTSDLDSADQVVSELDALGIDLLQLGEELESEGVVAFIEALDGVLEAIEGKRKEMLA